LFLILNDGKRLMRQSRKKTKLFLSYAVFCCYPVTFELKMRISAYFSLEVVCQYRTDWFTLLFAHRLKKNGKAPVENVCDRKTSGFKQFFAPRGFNQFKLAPTAFCWNPQCWYPPPPNPMSKTWKHSCNVAPAHLKTQGAALQLSSSIPPAWEASNDAGYDGPVLFRDRTTQLSQPSDGVLATDGCRGVIARLG
jgi:hypothetical protein